MAAARKFYKKFLPQLGFVQEKPGRYCHTFYSAGGDKPSEFFCFERDKNHKPNRTRIAFWADTHEEVDQIAELVRGAGGKALEGSMLCSSYSPGYYAFSSRTRTATSWRSAAGRVRSLRNDLVSANG